MKIGIDISVIAPENKAMGHLEGAIELDVIPRIGEIISFLSPKTTVIPINLVQYSKQLKVEELLHMPNSENLQVLLYLEDVTFKTLEDAMSFARYMKQGFDLDLVLYD